MKLQPIGNKILVKPQDAVTRVGSIIIPEAAQEKSQEATVITIGTGERQKDGTKKPFEVKPGDKLLISKFGGTEIQYEGSTHLLVDADDVIAILN